MKPEDIVCTFDQAALIYSYGVRFDNTVFQWSQNKKTSEKKVFLTDINPISYDWVYVFPAYTVCEFGCLLKEYNIVNYREQWWLEDCYRNYIYAIKLVGERVNEAEARAEAFIWLANNGFINPKELKL